MSIHQSPLVFPTVTPKLIRMMRILITGSSDGLGLLAARSLIAKGHTVTFHARNARRAEQTGAAAPGAAAILVADVSTLDGMKQLAAAANAAATAQGAPFDVVVHNAGVGYTGPFVETGDGYAQTFAVNSLAPYVLTCLMHRPRRLVYVSSGLHLNARAEFGDITWVSRQWDAGRAYADSKLQNVLLALAVARKWGGVESVALTPGWVKTKIDGWAGPGEAADGQERIVRLVDSPVEQGKYYDKDGLVDRQHSAATDETVQEGYLKACRELTGLTL